MGAAAEIDENTGEEGCVHGRVYAVDDKWLAALDALHCQGTRGSVEIALRSSAADAAGATDARGAETIICQSWLLQVDPKME